MISGAKKWSEMLRVTQLLMGGGEEPGALSSQFSALITHTMALL